MDTEITKMFKKWYGNPPAQKKDVHDYSSKNTLFQQDVADFYLLSNGGEGLCGNTYISLWPIEQINELNTSYQIIKYLGNDYLAIGSDGSGDCLALRKANNSNTVQLIFVPFGDLDIDSARVVGSGFSDGIRNCFTGAYKHPE